MRKSDAKPPQVGLYTRHRLPGEKYHALNAANFSSLKEMDRSPAHAYHTYQEPREPSPALNLGDAAHAIVLEPERLEAHYFPAPTEQKRYAAERKAWKAAEEENPNKTPLRPSEWGHLQQIRDAVMRHPYARELVEHAVAHDMVEVSAVWDCPDTGVRCKLRVDGISRFQGAACIFDVKTCLDASVRYWQRHIPRYWYHAQGAHYLAGLQTLYPTATPRAFYFLAVEKKPPYGIMVHELNPHDAEVGALKVREWLRAWAECESTGRWPNYPVEIGRPLLPEWAAQVEGIEDGW